MRRKNRFETYREAPDRGPYDELPMLELGIDPQVHLSRNDRLQPFFLICEQDTVLVQMSGEGRIEFRNSPVNYFNLVMGDFVYVPGGTPHRIAPRTESVQLRYKAEHAGLEGVAWYSARTGEEISRVVWDTAKELPQEGYLRACRSFNADRTMRTCKATGEVLPEIDLSPYRWAEAATAVREAEAAESARAEKKGGEPRVRPSRTGKLVIVDPAEDKPPLKVNVYEFARMATTALSPMFPCFAPGCIVPCVALQNPGERGPMGYFVHYNTVQEVVLSFGTRGSFLVPGGVYVGTYTHGVGQKPGQAGDNPNMMNVSVITQRQAVDGPQREAVMFMCEKCGEEVLRCDYGAHEFPDLLDGDVEPWMIGLPTISQSARAAAKFNESEPTRTCGKCGHVNARFPVDYWGWTEYRRRTRVVVEARRIMVDAQTRSRIGAAE
jgi:3-hydroxyanthranilate 3,4-dioxygenase